MLYRGMKVDPADGQPLAESTARGPWRRPPEHGGEGDDPVWKIDEGDIGDRLVYSVDPADPMHGFIEPAFQMPLEDYQEALAETRQLWRQCRRRADVTGSRTPTHCR